VWGWQTQTVTRVVGLWRTRSTILIAYLVSVLSAGCALRTLSNEPGRQNLVVRGYIAARVGGRDDVNGLPSSNAAGSWRWREFISLLCNIHSSVEYAMSGKCQTSGILTPSDRRLGARAADQTRDFGRRADGAENESTLESSGRRYECAALRAARHRYCLRRRCGNRVYGPAT